MTDSRAHRLAGRWVNPEGTNLVVITRTSGEPLCLIEQIDLHLVIVEHRLALTDGSHAELLHIGLIELLSLLQEIVHIHSQFLWHRLRIRVIAKSRLPEHEEVFALLHSPPRPLGIASQHILRSLLKSLIPCARSKILGIIGNLGRIHNL